MTMKKGSIKKKISKLCSHLPNGKETNEIVVEAPNLAETG